MATMAREAWTDERLDDLKDGMHREFGQVNREFEWVRREFERVHREFERVDRRFEQVHVEIRETNARIDSLGEGLNARFDAMQRTMVVGFASIAATTLASVSGAIAANALL